MRQALNSSGPSVPEWSWLCGVPGSGTCSASAVTVCGARRGHTGHQRHVKGQPTGAPCSGWGERNRKKWHADRKTGKKNKKCTTLDITMTFQDVLKMLLEQFLLRELTFRAFEWQKQLMLRSLKISISQVNYLHHCLLSSVRSPVFH